MLNVKCRNFRLCGGGTPRRMPEILSEFRNEPPVSTGVAMGGYLEKVTETSDTRSDNYESILTLVAVEIADYSEATMRLRSIKKSSPSQQ
jgi:hypothetical protein